MEIIADPIDRRLLDDWQRNLPITTRPFAVLGKELGIEEAEVLHRLKQMRKSGRITRVGATCAPNTVSASTLAAVAAPDDHVDTISAIIGSEPGVNHSYLREDFWNIWFVVTGPDRAYINDALKRIEDNTKLQVLDLPLVRPFNVDLGFRMSKSGNRLPNPVPRTVDASVIQGGDRDILQALTSGLSIVERPFEQIASRLGRREDEILARIAALHDAAIITRLGVIVRHRALGWSSNAMVVWQMEPDEIDYAGPKLAAFPGVTLCYERAPVGDVWPYRLYCMIHGRSRTETLEVLRGIRELPEMTEVPHKVLFSTRCFKQTGAMITAKPEVAA